MSTKEKVSTKVKEKVSSKDKVSKKGESSGEEKSVKSAVKKKIEDKVEKSAKGSEKSKDKSLDKSKDKIKDKSMDKSKDEINKSEVNIDVPAGEANVDPIKPLEPAPIMYEFQNDTNETLVQDKNSANQNKIVTVEEAQRIRSQWTSQVVQNVLYSKRESLVSQIKSLDERIEEVKNNRIFIEREIKSEQNTMVERVKNIEGNKVAHLVHEMNEIQKDIDRVDYIAGTTGDQLAHNKVIEFLANFKEMQQSIEQAVTKPYKDNIDVEATDFVNEVEERNKKLKDYDLLLQELNAKDEVIYKLIEENNENVNTAIDEIKASTEAEVGQWMDLTENQKSELGQALKLRTGLKDYVDILKEKFKLDDNMNRIVERYEGQNLLKQNYDKTRTLKVDVRDVISTVFNLLQLTKGSNEYMDTMNTDSNHVSRIVKRIKMYYDNNSLGTKLEFADQEDKGRIHIEVATKMLNKEFKDIAIGEEVKTIVEFYSDKEGFDYKMFVHKFYEQDKNKLDKEYNNENNGYEYENVHENINNDFKMKNNNYTNESYNKLKTKFEDPKEVEHINARTIGKYDNRLSKKKELIRLSAEDYRNSKSDDE